MSRAHGFFRSPEGRSNQLQPPFPDGWSTHPDALNKHGQIIGVYYETGRVLQGLGSLYENGVFSKLTLPKADITLAHGHKRSWADRRALLLPRYRELWCNPLWHLSV